MKLLLLLLATVAFAQLNQRPVDPTDEAYYTIGDVEVKEVESNDIPVVAENKEENAIDWALVWNIAQKVWDIVQANHPVVNWNQNYGTIVPKGLSSWEAMEGWHAPTSRTYSITYKNLYGMSVVSFNYRIVWTYGGSYNGRGRYLSHVTVDPANLDVAWGYTFEAGVNLADPVNIGTTASPVAGVQVDLRWKVKTVLKENNKTYSYFVDGTGKFSEV